MVDGVFTVQQWAWSGRQISVGALWGSGLHIYQKVWAHNRACRLGSSAFLSPFMVYSMHGGLGSDMGSSASLPSPAQATTVPFCCSIGTHFAVLAGLL